MRMYISTQPAMLPTRGIPVNVVEVGPARKTKQLTHKADRRKARLHLDTGVGCTRRCGRAVIGDLTAGDAEQLQLAGGL